jgi:hypothetical protein
MNFTINRIIVFLVAGGFGFLFIETLMEHTGILEAHPQVYIPIIFSAIGFALAVATAVIWKEPLIKILHVYLFASLLVSFGGLYFHNEDRLEGEEPRSGELSAGVNAETRYRQKNGEAELHIKPRGRKKLPPMLAPLAFAGLTTMGLVGTLRKWGAEVR